MNYNTFDGSAYAVTQLNVRDEIIPEFAFFKLYPDEVHVFDSREGSLSRHQVTVALENGTISRFDKTLLCEIAVFSSGFCISRTLKERLAMKGITVSNTVFESSFKRLHRHQLINFSRIVSADGRPVNARLISLTAYGSYVAKSLGVVHRFNEFAMASSDVPTVKAHGQGAQFLTNIQKNIIVDKFSFRPVIVKDSEDGAIVRPTFSIKLFGEVLYCEVVRRKPGWLEDLEEKLHRYELVFGRDNPQSVVINCEDEDMCKEAFCYFKDKSISTELLYTDDLASFGVGFQTCLYSFDEHMRKTCFSIINPKMEAV